MPDRARENAEPVAGCDARMRKPARANSVPGAQRTGFMRQ